MAIMRNSLATIETAILQIFGYAASTAAPWTNAGSLYVRVNEYGQRLPMRIAETAQSLRQQGMRVPQSGVPRFDMWKTSATMTATSGSSTIHFPADYDHYISFWDNTNSRPVYAIEDVERYHLKLRTRSAGPPEYIEIKGFVLNSTTWQRAGTIWPPTVASVTPSINISYWRIPAKMAGADAANEYPDIDPKYQSLFIYGPVVDLARPSSPEFDRYAALEKELLIELAMTARGV